MLFAGLLINAQRRLEKRRRFNQLSAEIEGLTSRDLADLHADRGEMLRDLRRAIYG